LPFRHGPALSLHARGRTLPVMPSDRTLHGTLRQCEQPVWQPLLDLVGAELAEWFMWMHEIELADGSAVHAYKHVATRRYFHLTEDGRAFFYRSEAKYTEVAPREAIDAAFAGWEELLPAPTDPDAVRAALRRARATCALRTSGDSA
jgi:hypothetical protein